ncbi:cystatin-C-like [Melanotaenia boesemani]|uniref:cystatin-C-like n=1 Tax=Melanotaenia boesemani TaxID=1250792 RepID=UPI001C04A855|nr:cystatin-C-like [Melanotaenia boesemani]
MLWKIVFTLLMAVFAVVLSGMPGGVTDIDINDEGVQHAVHFAIEQHNRNSNDVYIYRVVEIVRAQIQVVEGVNYIITVKIIMTSCRKDIYNEECGFIPNPNARPYQCTFTVWSRPWINDIRLTDDTC